MTRGIAAVLVALGLAVGLYVLSPPETPDTATTTDTEPESLRQRAEQGDADAQFNLGDLYYFGEGVPQDDAEAAAWYRKAADQGHAGAQYSLGFMYATGQGVPQDYVEAARWYRLVADQGDAAGQYSLGVMYATGRGVPQDDVEAVAWYHKAADQGNVFAQSSLGVMYATGQGVPQDYVEAHKWHNLAASRATGDDKQDAERKDAVAILITPAQLAEAQKRASEWQAAFDARQK